MQNKGKECVLVTSGAIAYGKQLLSQELMMSMSMRETLNAGHNTKEVSNDAINHRLVVYIYISKAYQTRNENLYDQQFIGNSSIYGVWI